MGLPVVTVASGGLPIVESTVGGTPVTEATNGRGVAVTKVVGKPGLPVVFETIGAGSTGPGPEATAFLARTSGLDATHTNAYTALINGLVADGIWSKLDVLHVYATQDATTAQLNLISSSFPATMHGAPTFTADRGYTGTEGSGSIYIDTGFNPSTAPTPKFVLNSAHISAWVVTNGDATAAVGASGTTNSYVFPRNANLTYLRINDGTGGSESVANLDSRGWFVVNRSGASACQAYKNGSSVFSNAASSTAVPGNNLYSIGWNSGGSPMGYGQQQAMISIGSSLNSTDAINFYNRLRTYLTAVGVP